MLDVGVAVHRGRRDAQPLGLGHGRVVDRLHVDAVLVEQPVGDPLALGPASPTITGTMWLSFIMCGMPARRAARTFATITFCWRSRSVADLEMPDRGDRAGGKRRRNGGGEDEAGRKAAHEVDSAREPVM
jgi:hypothetical protein